MGIESGFLRELPGLLFLLAGLLSQLYLGHRLRLGKRTNAALAAIPLLGALMTRTFARPVTQFLPSGYGIGFFGGVLTLWCWMLVVPAVVLWALRRIPRRPFQPDRRIFLNASAGLLCAAPAAVLSAGIIKRKDFQVQEMDLKFAHLPKDLRGLRLVQISDIHMSDYYSAADLRRVVDACNGLNAHLVFVTGDLVTSKYDPLENCLLELKRLRAASGVWGCLGNHEQHEKIEDEATRRGLQCDVRFLRQQAVPLTFGQHKLNLVGVDHQRISKPYLQDVNQLVSPQDFNLLLSHNPAVFPVAAGKGFQLTLAGHTHGGQINVALAGQNLNIVDFVTPYTKGLYQLPGSSLYVNSGLGTIGVPVRLGSPPEITLIRLCDS